MIKKKEFFMRN